MKLRTEIISEHALALNASLLPSVALLHTTTVQILCFLAAYRVPLTTRTTYHVMGSPVRDASIIQVNWSVLRKSCNYLPNMSVMQLTAIVATAYHAVIKGVPELN
jgi:hypothetical protein